VRRQENRRTAEELDDLEIDEKLRSLLPEIGGGSSPGGGSHTDRPAAGLGNVDGMVDKMDSMDAAALAELTQKV
jgi:hypothetical protein